MEIDVSDITISYRLRDTIKEATGEEVEYEWTLEDLINVLCQTITRLKRQNNLT